jgi:hypothetical protein
MPETPSETPWRHLFDLVLKNATDRVDEDLLPTLYAAASVRTADVRAELTEQGVLWSDPVTGRHPTPAELDAAAQTLIERAARAATVRGAVAGAAGLAAVPPELVAAVVQTLRLSQRLAVLYGHDPEGDAGRLLLTRALALAFDVELPEQRQAAVRVRDLPAVLDRHLPVRFDGEPSFGRTLTMRALVTVASRMIRVLPGVGAGVGALGARRNLRRRGARMVEVFRRASEGLLSIEGPVEEAVEV